MCKQASACRLCAKTDVLPARSICPFKVNFCAGRYTYKKGAAGVYALSL